MIGSKIKQWREKKNLTQEFLADQLKISQSAYSRLENDETDCTFTRIVEIAKILGLKGPEELIAGDRPLVSLMHNENASGITFNQGWDYRDEYIRTLKEQILLLQRVVEEALNKKIKDKSRKK